MILSFDQALAFLIMVSGTFRPRKFWPLISSRALRVTLHPGVACNLTVCCYRIREVRMATQITFVSKGNAVQAELYRPSVGEAGVALAGVVVIAYGSDGLIDNQIGPWATMIRSR
jgi:hypothetical protein